MPELPDSSDPRPFVTAAGIVAVSGALLTIGVIMVASAGASLSEPIIKLEMWKSTAGRQIIFAAFGILMILSLKRWGPWMLRWSPRTWAWLSWGFFAVCTILLALVLHPSIGTERNHAYRWIYIGSSDHGFGFQPSEIAKIMLIFVLSVHLSRPIEVVQSFWKGCLPAALAIGATAALVGKEDFGTAALLSGVGGILLLVGGCRIWHLIILGLPGIFGLAYLVIIEPYRMKRLTGFRHIWEDAGDSGYHQIQSLVAIHSGGWYGRGLGNSVQKFGHLPESTTDFIYSILCEETGIVGGYTVIALYLAFMWLGWRTIRRAPNPFCRLLATGITVLICMQAAINIAVVTVCAPAKGIALPLISSGGSGVVLLCCSIGILAAIATMGEYPPRKVKGA